MLVNYCSRTNTIEQKHDFPRKQCVGSIDSKLVSQRSPSNAVSTGNVHIRIKVFFDHTCLLLFGLFCSRRWWRRDSSFLSTLAVRSDYTEAFCFLVGQNSMVNAPNAFENSKGNKRVSMHCSDIILLLLVAPYSKADNRPTTDNGHPTYHSCAIALPGRWLRSVS
jgi:hypothetical protein